MKTDHTFATPVNFENYLKKIRSESGLKFKTGIAISIKNGVMRSGSKSARTNCADMQEIEVVVLAYHIEDGMASSIYFPNDHNISRKEWDEVKKFIINHIKKFG